MNCQIKCLWGAKPSFGGSGVVLVVFVYSCVSVSGVLFSLSLCLCVCVCECVCV